MVDLSDVRTIVDAIHLYLQQIVELAQVVSLPWSDSGYYYLTNIGHNCTQLEER